MTQNDLPSVVGVLTVVGLINLLLPFIGPTSPEVHAGRAMAAAALLLTAPLLWFKVKASRARLIRLGLGGMIVFGSATLASVPWAHVRPAGLAVALPLLLTPAIAAYLGVRRS